MYGCKLLAAILATVAVTEEDPPVIVSVVNVPSVSITLTIPAVFALFVFAKLTNLPVAADVPPVIVSSVVYRPLFDTLVRVNFVVIS